MRSPDIRWHPDDQHPTLAYMACLASFEDRSYQFKLYLHVPTGDHWQYRRDLDTGSEAWYYGEVVQHARV